MNGYRNETIEKVIGILTLSKNDVSPIEWLTEYYGFTQEEAEWFVKKVQEIHGQKISEK